MNLFLFFCSSLSVIFIFLCTLFPYFPLLLRCLLLPARPVLLFCEKVFSFLHVHLFRGPFSPFSLHFFFSYFSPPVFLADPLTLCRGTSRFKKRARATTSSRRCRTSMIYYSTDYRSGKVGVRQGMVWMSLTCGPFSGGSGRTGLWTIVPMLSSWMDESLHTKR